MQFYINHASHLKLFHDGGPYHLEASPLICSANLISLLYKILSFRCFVRGVLRTQSNIYDRDIISGLQLYNKKYHQKLKYF